MPSRPAILVIEDEKPMHDFVRKNLEARGFQVHIATSGLEALAFFHTEVIDLIVLDLMLPVMDGLETLRRIRQTALTPVIVLTALGEEKDKVSALDLGADDYLTKPFGVEELLARIRALLRRAQAQPAPAPTNVLRVGEIALDESARSVTRRGEPVRLTSIEYDLLRYLMQNKGKVLTHRMILQTVWGPEYGNESEYLRVYTRRLRQKLETDPLNPVHLLTEHGVGYCFR